jgi:hypothetical protein
MKVILMLLFKLDQLVLGLDMYPYLGEMMAGKQAPKWVPLPFLLLLKMPSPLLPLHLEDLTLMVTIDLEFT